MDGIAVVVISLVLMAAAGGVSFISSIRAISRVNGELTREEERHSEAQ